MEEFDPVIVAYCCHYCAYTAADMAGSMRLGYPPGIKIIRVPCTGKVDPLHVMRALMDGADGVLIAGCLKGDCHFKNGNIKALKRTAYLKQWMDEIGIESERVEMVMMSAGMGKQFVRIVTDFLDNIRLLGPCPKNTNQQSNRILSELV
ncbi:MAG: hydrogenase iron-sulfur subunit [Desulfobacteraceae bacterium]|nr:hydrogenase iron-sulfur subunit [Desulfobacteraceae bacterium]